MERAAELLIGTRKGLLQLERGARGGYELKRESFIGAPVVYAWKDPRNGTIWASPDHGHWGVKLHRSEDGGASWEEIQVVYPEGAEKKPGEPAKMELIWYIAPGGVDEPQKLYLGTNPGGLFVSEDGGRTFALNRPLWDHPSRPEFWFGGGRDSAGICSFWVDPRDSRRLIAGVSCGGVFLSEDGGATWESRTKGLTAGFLPDPNAEFGHDPHFMTFCASQPDVWWQQNHCGIFVTQDGGRQWREVSEASGPARFGWAVSVDPQDPDTAWVVPAAADDMRYAHERSLCVSRTTDGGKTWTALRQGLPQQHAYDIVYRHALDLRGDELAFGSTTGNLYLSADRGDSWTPLAANYPPIYSVRFA